MPYRSATRAIVRAANSGWVLMPEPVAVPPSATSAISPLARSTRSMPFSTWRAYPPNSWPRRTGVASMRCVRPDLTMPSKSRACAARAPFSDPSAGTSSSRIAARHETWIAVGMMSFDDWP